MRRWTFVLVLISLPVAAHGAVLCVRPTRSGTLNGTVRVRAACKPNEVQLSPQDVGFCCETSVTTTTTSSTMCPTFTTTTLGIPDCGGVGTCGGLCANARECVAGVGGACECTGAELPCGVVSIGGACGGTCPGGSTCDLFAPPLPNGCPGLPRCGCVPLP